MSKKLNLMFISIIYWILLGLAESFRFEHIQQGARLVDPPGRSSLWRENLKDSVTNVLDHRQNCGGADVSIS